MIQLQANQRLVFLLGSLAFATLWAVVAAAGPFEPARIPADTKWVHHMDLEAMRASQVGRWIRKKWSSHERVQEKIADMIAKTGMDPREDLRSITIYDYRFKKHHGVMTIELTHADSQKMLAALQEKHPDVRLSIYDGHRLYTWQKGSQDGEPRYITGTICDGNTLVLSNNHISVMNTIDVLAGKAPGLPQSSPLASASPAGTIWIARAIAMSGADLPGDCPVLQQCDQLSLAAGEQGDHLFMNCSLVANSAEVATNTINVVNGLRSLAMLRFGSDKSLTRLMNEITAESDDQLISLDWRGNGKDLLQLMQKIKENCKSGRRGWGRGDCLDGSCDRGDGNSDRKKNWMRHAWWTKYQQRKNKTSGDGNCPKCTEDKPCDKCPGATECAQCHKGETCEKCQSPADCSQCSKDKTCAKCSLSKTENDSAEKFARLPNLIELGAQNEHFSTLATAVQAAGLVKTLRGTGPFTVFAPTNEAFDKLPEGTVQSLLEPENRQQLVDILTYHVVAGRVLAADVVKLSKATTLQGTNLPIEVRGDQVYVGNAQVLETNIEANNGVIHVIDSVLLPAGGDSEDGTASRIICDFQGNKAGNDWRAINDNVMGGISEGGARVTGDDILKFSGNLSLENRGGFASIRSEAKKLGLQDGEALVVRIRGDGRQYYLNLHVPTRHMAFSYRAPIDTIANQWQEIRIPLSEFYGTSFGRRVSDAELDPEEVNSLGFLLADKQPGPFNLDIDWIKAE